jgi:hypothetical protein
MFVALGVNPGLSESQYPFSSLSKERACPVSLSESRRDEMFVALGVNPGLIETPISLFPSLARESLPRLSS